MYQKLWQQREGPRHEDRQCGFDDSECSNIEEVDEEGVKRKEKKKTVQQCVFLTAGEWESSEGESTSKIMSEEK